MGKNEIRLRRESMSPGKIHRHQNYSALMRKHGRYLKLKRIMYILYFVVLVILFGMIMYVINLQRRQHAKEKPKSEVMRGEVGAQRNICQLQERKLRADGQHAAIRVISRPKALTSMGNSQFPTP